MTNTQEASDGLVKMLSTGGFMLGPPDNVVLQALSLRQRQQHVDDMTAKFEALHGMSGRLPLPLLPR